LQKFGVTEPFSTPEARVKNVSLETQQKRHETLRKNGTYGSSKPEEECYQQLCEKFTHVERQVRVHRWPIDFYIVSIDTYIQFDGIYWHGLDRPIEEIAQHKTKHDVQIHKKWLTDREQDLWFRENNLRLVRLSDLSQISTILAS
jgi:hypothetical protein